MGPGGIIHALNELMDRRGHLADDDLRALAEQLAVPLYRLEGVASFYPHFRRTPPPRAAVSLCRDVACRMAGGADLAARARAALEGREGVEVHAVSCLGRCDAAPAVAVNDHPVPLPPGGDLGPLLAAVDVPPCAHAPPEPTAAPRRWASDPYTAAGDRYGVLRRFVKAGLDADRVVAELTSSGLRGMGGAGFPTGLKWKLVRAEPEREKFVVCNADESEPGTFKDRVVLEEMPHLVIEGMAIAALTVGAERGVVFIRHEYGKERVALARALDDARARGVLGASVLGSGRPFEVNLFVSPGGYILGEETALLECLEDKRGEPRNKPPFPGQKGLFGKPTLINNVETFSLIPAILDGGAEAWKARGAPGFAGLKLVAISGDVARPGVYQVPMGTPIRALVEMAGGVRDGKRVLAIAPGGASSNFLRDDALDAPLDFKALADRGSMLGSGAVLIVAEGRDLVDLAANVVAFFRNESCGKCVPCRLGSEKAVAILEQALEGRGSRRHLALLPELADTMTQTSICGLGQVALGPFLSVLAAFPDQVRARFPEE
jgi:NADH:ubiquinone oxidoreductase subunit F (NADH-binding)